MIVNAVCIPGPKLWPCIDWGYLMWFREPFQEGKFDEPHYKNAAKQENLK